MQSKKRFMVFPGFNPVENLAWEHSLFENLCDDTQILLFYRNDTSVICGKHQNPWYEVNIDFVNQRGIPLIRRMSGGGTVFHDLGNLNYSFMGKKDLVSQEKNLDFLLDVLKDFGINGTKSSRGDLLAGEKKFSGNALWYPKGKVLHHGTLLFDGDVSMIHRSLLGFRNDGDFECSGNWVDSKPSPVCNLRDVNSIIGIPDFLRAVENKWLAEGVAEHQYPEDPDIVQDFYQLCDQYGSWEWNYGRTHGFSCTLGDIDRKVVTIEHGLIQTIDYNESEGASTRLQSPGDIRFFGSRSLQLIKQWNQWDSTSEMLLWNGLAGLGD